MLLRVEVDGERYELRPQDGPVELGRLPTCGVRVAHPQVSRSHGELSWDGGDWLYHDRSRHGTIVYEEGRVVAVAHRSAVRLPVRCELALAGESGPRVRCQAVEAPRDPEPPREIFRRAADAQARGEAAEAAAGFLQLARRDPPVTEALRRAAECLESLGRVPEALVWATRYSFHRDRDPGAWKLLACLHASRGEVEDARQCLARARELDPADPEVAALATRVAAASQAAAVLGHSTVELLGDSIPHRLETTHFTIDCDFAAHGRLLPDLAKALEGALGRVASFTAAPPGRIAVELTTRAADPGAAPFLGERNAAASCDHGCIRIYLPAARARACRDVAYLACLALHEVVHAVLLRVSDRLPWWVHEGLAQFVSTGEQHEGCLPRPPRPAALSRWERPPATAETDHAYALAHFAVVVLVRRLGAEGLRQLLEAMGAGEGASKPLDRAGIAYEELSRAAWDLWGQQGATGRCEPITLDHIARRPR